VVGLEEDGDGGGRAAREGDVVDARRELCLAKPAKARREQSRSGRRVVVRRQRSAAQAS
jgi:hypothetical protein